MFLKAKQYLKEVADMSKTKRNPNVLHQQQLQQQQLQLQQQAQPTSPERYNLLSSGIDERPPVTSVIPKPLSVDFFPSFFMILFLVLSFFFRIRLYFACITLYTLVDQNPITLLFVISFVSALPRELEKE